MYLLNHTGQPQKNKCLLTKRTPYATLNMKIYHSTKKNHMTVPSIIYTKE